MWFVGLLIGGFIGAIAHGFEGFLVGAILGALAGAVLRLVTQGGPSAAAGARLDALGKAVDELRVRVAALERRTGAAPEARPAEPAHAPVTTADDLAELARVNAAVEAAAREVSTPAPVEREPVAFVRETVRDSTLDRTSDQTPQIIGAVVGAVIGVFGGMFAMIVCAFLGWAIVAGVQRHNRRVEIDAQRYGRKRVPQPPLSARVEEPQAPTPAEARDEPAIAASVETPEPTPPAPPVEPPPPAYAWFQRLIGGNIVAKIGVLILFFGVGFLLKYIYDRALLPVPVRLAGVALAGFGMIYTGWRLRDRRRLYGLILQGGGVGVLYLDVYFALRVYNLIDALPGFAAFMTLGVTATLLAVRQNARILAVLGLTGAFLAPILASTNAGNHVALFSYYTLLNAFILAISWFRAWRELNLVGFIFTFVVGVLWGAGSYRPENFATVEPFVLIFFAMYLVIPILFAQRQPPQLKGFVDGTLVFGTPLAVAYMQAWLVKDLPYGLAWSAAVAAGLYAVLAALTLRREGMRLLGETYAALAVAFLTLAIFFAFDAYVTFALWTLEGAAIFWVGLRQRRLLARVFGLALQIGGAAYFLLKYATYDLSNPWWNAFVSGCVIIAAAGFITAALMRKFREALDPAFEPDEIVPLVWAALWWSAAGVHALYHAFAWPQFMCGLLVFAALSVAAADLAGERLQWTHLRRLTYAHLPALVVIACMIAFGEHGRLGFARPLAEGGYWAWPLNFAVAFWVHARHVRAGLQSADSVIYRGIWLLIGAIATWDVLWLIDKRLYGQGLTWGGAAIAAACARFLLRERGRAGALPISPFVLGWGAIVWFGSGLAWIERVLDGPTSPPATIAFVAASCLAFELLGIVARWSAPRRITVALPVGLAYTLMLQIARDVHPFSHYGWVAWPLAIMAVYVILRRQERDRVALVEDFQHMVALWLAVAVATWELAWQARDAGLGTMWWTAAWAAVPAATLGAVSAFSARALWPFDAHRETYRLAGAGPLAVWLGLWMIYGNVNSPGSTSPLPYIPLLNALDLAHVLAFAALWRWSRTFADDEDAASVSAIAFPVLGFVWLNCILLRTVHYWAGVDYEWSALMESVAVQTGLSLLWTATAFVLMLYATRSRHRSLWIAGAVLLAVVVLKLFVHDLGSVGTIARIVSFIGVGVGLLVIGYVAPVPPGDVERQAD